MKLVSAAILLGLLGGLGGAPLVAVEPVPIPEGYEAPFFPAGKPLEGLIITIDPGHGGSAFSGGYSGSARGVETRVVEGDLNMRVSALLYHHLRDAGAQVHLTRRDDRKVTLGSTGREQELGARTRLAMETTSHLFLSIHHNSTTRRTADGVVILIDPTDSAGNAQPLETSFADILREEVALKVHQKEHFSHYIISHPLVSSVDIPSAVVEYGFLSNPEFDAWVADPRNHRIEARATFNALVRMWQENREALEELRTRLFPELALAKPTVALEQNPAFTYGIPPRNLWPFDTPVKDKEQALFLINNLRHATLTDRTTVWFKPVIDTQDRMWRLNVTTNLPQLAEAARVNLEKAAAKGIMLDVTELPSPNVGDSPFGVVSIPMALTWSGPSEGEGVQTQLLLGEPLYLLDHEARRGYFLVQGIDGYTGWVRADAVRKVSRAEFTDRINGERPRVVRDLRVDDFRVPPGSIADAEPTTHTLGLWRLQGARGKWVEVEAAALRMNQTPSIGRTVAEMALREFLYAPYVFGGRTPDGVDCSGFVGVVWASAGVQLPRDANQQTLVGRLVGTSWYRDALLPGDLLFFVDRSGRTIHTGVYLGDSNFIHASPPEVQINSFDPTNPLYSQTWDEAFHVARRPLQ